jgi:hypothetical protein
MYPPYNEAAKIRRKELDSIRKILKSLNSKKILEKNLLKVNFEEPFQLKISLSH